MGNSTPLILEITSDEAVGFGDTKNSIGHGIGDVEFGDGESYEWFSKLLSEINENKDNGSDDQVLVNEELSNPTKKPRFESSKPPAKVFGEESDDDDCVVLDGDPNKSMVLVNRRPNDDADSNDLEIVGEKGEVACRDFPHPRHLCAKFPFALTPHNIHCGQCHCYVCESLAPCSHWGTGICSINHCHASDEDKYWRAERIRVKKGGKPVAIIPSISHTSPLEEAIQTTQSPALTSQQSNSLLHTQGSSLVTVHSFPVSVDKVTNQGTIHPYRCVVPTYKPQSQSALLQSQPKSDNNVASSDTSHNARSWSTSSFLPTSQNNRLASSSRFSGYLTLKRFHPFQTLLMNGSHGSNHHIGTPVAQSTLVQPKLSFPQNKDIVCGTYVTSKPLTHSQSYQNCFITDPMLSQSQNPSQEKITPQLSVENLEKLILFQPHAVFQSEKPTPYLPSTSYMSDVYKSYGFGDQLHLGSMISSSPNMGNNFEKQSSKQAHSNLTSTVIDGQNPF